MDNNQVKRQANNLVGVVIFVNTNSEKEQMGNSYEGRENIDDDSEISAGESIEGKEDDFMETSSAWHFFPPSCLSGTVEILPLKGSWVLTDPLNATLAPSPCPLHML